MTYVVGEPCSLYIDLPLGDAVAPGDWIATEAGARYLIHKARRVASRRHAQRNRYTLTVERLERNLDPPAEVYCVWLCWYSRDRSP